MGFNKLSHKKYEYLEHTADVGIRAYGKTLNEAFENSAIALFNLISNIEKINVIKKFSIDILGFDLENLFYKWIESLLIIHDSYNVILSRFNVNIDMNTLNLSGTVGGETFNRDTHEKRVVVKAITYHEIKIVEEEGLVMIEFVVDI
ncbi:archease [Sulfolobales archaeon HS-7]|nr:archease [Sulfolobales archaeon HS-7]